MPGFIAGLLSQAGQVNEDVNEWVYPDTRIPDRMLVPVVEAFLYPSAELMKRSPVMQEFYLWQFDRAGGNRLDDID